MWTKKQNREENISACIMLQELFIQPWESKGQRQWLPEDHQKGMEKHCSLVEWEKTVFKIKAPVFQVDTILISSKNLLL